MTLLIDGSGLDTISSGGLNGAIELIRRACIVDMKLDLITCNTRKTSVDELPGQGHMTNTNNR